MLELIIAASHEAVDWVGMVLGQHGYSGPVEVVTTPADPTEPTSEAAPAQRDVLIRLYVPPGPSEQTDAAGMIAALDGLRRAGLIDAPIQRKHDTSVLATLAHPGDPVAIGERFLVVPPDWAGSSADRIVIRLAPGMALALACIPRHARVCS